MKATKYSLVLSLLITTGISSAIYAQDGDQKITINTCTQYKMIVVAPDEKIDTKMVSKPDPRVVAKGTIINPCEKDLVLAIKPETGAKTKLKPVTEILSASEMLKKARKKIASEEQK